MKRALAAAAAATAAIAGPGLIVPAAAPAFAAGQQPAAQTAVKVVPKLTKASYQGRDSHGKCLVKVAGTTSKFVAGSTVRLVSSTGAGLGSGKVTKTSGGHGRYAVVSHLTCGTRPLIRPLARHGATGSGNAVGLAVPRSQPPVGTSVLGPVHIVYGGVIGPGGPYIPGQVPSSCPTGTFSAGQPFTIVDSATNVQIATGSIGGCQMKTTTDPACIPGLGCTPALVDPVWTLRTRNPLPEQLKGYVFRIGKSRWTVTRSAMVNDGWNVLLGDPD